MKPQKNFPINHSMIEHAESLRLKSVLRFLKPRAQTAHKGDFGHVLIIGGDIGYSGAPRIAALAAARVGAGLVTIATRSEYALMANALQPEIMCYGIEKPKDLVPLIQRATVLAIGPGLGQSEWSHRLFKQVCSVHLPIILDADALNLLALKKTFTRENWILTPHPGEAARLLQVPVDEIQHHRIQSAAAIQSKYQGVCVLKGAGTIVKAKEGVPKICRVGNPGMSSGGMGDLLTGIIAGLVAQGLSLSHASMLGVCLHAHAGDLATKEGARGLLATDLLPILKRLVN